MHYLAKRHTDVEGVALDVGSAGNRDASDAVIVERRLGCIYSLDVSHSVVGVPSVLAVARGVETDAEGAEAAQIGFSTDDQTTVVGTAVGVERLITQVTNAVSTPGIEQIIFIIGPVAHRCDGKAVVGVGGIGATSLMTERSHIAGVVYGARIVVTSTFVPVSLIISRYRMVHQNL